MAISSAGPTLEAEIRRRIELAGPMPINQYMSLCLSHPEHGYYMTRDPLGRAGDFTTAPEISQIFGELIGLWAATVWQAMGAPANLLLVELGPGRGTLMRDVLRAAQVVPEFHAALAVHLVEISPLLAQLQRQTLNGLGAPVVWHQSLHDVPDGQLIVIANEFFDALPVHQAIRKSNGWHQRVVEVDRVGNLAFGVADEPTAHFNLLVPAALRNAPVDELYEWRDDLIAFELGRCIARNRGAALVIDYGHVEGAAGETLQAVGEHSYANPLLTPGVVDLTAHVDFQALANVAESMGACAHGPLTQGEFLRRLGIEARARVLKTNATQNQTMEIDSAVARLTDMSRTGMGEMFKVLGFADSCVKSLPGFEPSASWLR
jgi:NADH dehydrogenase [ubiquinone] 1 alpha subcomplex assembly factor 7